jgi:hypothetical protein
LRESIELGGLTPHPANIILTTHFKELGAESRGAAALAAPAWSESMNSPDRARAFARTRRI